MSHNPLSEEVVDLRREVRQLRGLLADLQDRVTQLESERSEFELVSAPSPRPLRAGEAPSSAASSRPSTAASGLSELRREAAEDVGRFIRRCLDGGHRGLSGRERVKLASRVYIVARTFEGRDLCPPVVANTFAQVTHLCKREGQLGESVCVGLPSLAEAQIAVETAGLVWRPPSGGSR